MTICRWLVLSLALGASAPLSAQDSSSHAITLPEAIALAQQRGHQARAARATREAALYRHRAYHSSLLPQLSLGGTVPSYNKSIIPVLQNDGSTKFLPQQQTDAALSLTLSQKIPVTGGDFFVSSALARVSVSGLDTFRLWSSTPVSVGVRQDLFRPNTAAWAGREDAARAELDERAYLEAMEDVALATTNAFYDLYAARVGLANAVTNAAVNDTLYRLNTGRFEVGKIGENDLLQSELVLLRSRSALESARLEYERAEARLRSGAGATLQASYGFNATGPEANLAYQNLLEARRFTLSVQVPIWQWGAHSEGVHAAEADHDRVASLSQATMGQVAHDARFAALELAQARRNVLLVAKSDSVAAKRFEVAYNRYVIGRIAIDNLYIAQAEKDQALLQYVQALRGYWGAHYRLRRATLFDFAAGRPIRG